MRMQQTELASPGDSPTVWGGAGGALGGTASLTLLALTVDWLLNGVPAHPTAAGMGILALYGALCGGVWGALMAAGTRRQWSALLGRKRVLVPLALGVLVGCLGVFLCLPFHAPIPLVPD